MCKQKALKEEHRPKPVSPDQISALSPNWLCDLKQVTSPLWTLDSHMKKRSLDEKMFALFLVASDSEIYLPYYQVGEPCVSKL